MQTRASTGRKLPNFLSAHADPSTWRDGDVVARTPWLLMSSVKRKLYAANYTAGPTFVYVNRPAARSFLCHLATYVRSSSHYYVTKLQNRVIQRDFFHSFPNKRTYLIESFNFKTENNTYANVLRTSDVTSCYEQLRAIVQLTKIWQGTTLIPGILYFDRYTTETQQRLPTPFHPMHLPGTVYPKSASTR